MYMKLKKIISIVLISMLAISLISCSNPNNKGDKYNKNQDRKLTNELLKEKEVYDGQVYFRDNWAIGAITIEDGVSEDKAKEIAQKYAEKIKNKYKDKKVNVQAVQDGNNIANIEL